MDTAKVETITPDQLVEYIQETEQKVQNTVNEEA